MSSFNNYGISVDKICNSALPTPLPPPPTPAAAEILMRILDHF